MTSCFALIGHPVHHSISPLIHNAALKAIGQKPDYRACDVPPSELEEAVARMRMPGFGGANVTIPHKTSIIPLLDDLTDSARAIGAVNTVVSERGRLTGHNTDHVGFAEPVGVLPRQTEVLVLGAGGAARAVVYALVNHMRAATVTITARRASQAQALADDFGPRVSAFPLNKLDVPSFGMLVQTTPVGMWPAVEYSPLDASLLREHQLVYDLIYNPAETRLMANGRRIGARVVGGLPMLIGQAAAAFELWTGQAMPRDVVDIAIASHYPHLCSD